MKVLFFIDNLLAGGKERRFTELLKGLNQISEIDFEIVVMSEEIYYKEILDLKVPIHFLLRKTKYDLSVFPKFLKICKIYKPSIIHSWSALTAIIAVPACKILKIKLVNGMVIDTPVVRNISNKYWFYAKLSFPFSDKIVGNSNAGLKAYGAPDRKTLCIYNGMDFNRFKNLKDPILIHKEVFGAIQPRFIVGMVARFESRKDYKTLIKAATTLIKEFKNLYFLLVGEGTELNEIKKCVPSSLNDKIIFLGGRTDIESVVNIFDVGILLTNAKVHGEGISNSIIEYMALHKPVIATYGGGTNEVVQDNVNGFLIRPGDNIELEESIRKLISNEGLRVQFGLNGYRLTQKRFDSRIMTKKYFSMYRELI